ncbi:MAG: 4-hydroxy-tetrahydrodipicolinate reductase [Oscillospiraceae bacterium]|nr:4-hydroxy-tetrahydrodipicolinate reductase [Oscillospiraceae bacterium]
MKILLSGIKGFMGSEVVKLCEKGVRDADLLAGVDINANGNEETLCFKTFNEVNVVSDVLIDFSHFSLTEALLDFAVMNNLPLVLATTGQTDEQRELIKEAAKKIPIFFAANYSLGVALLIELAKKTAATFPEADIEIVETHHNRKIDAPSGTALAIFDAVKSVRSNAVKKLGRAGLEKRTSDEIGLHAIRHGNIVGIHEVIVGTENQTITLRHEAHSRALFAEGALAAAQFLINKEPGLYTMNDLIKE